MTANLKLVEEAKAKGPLDITLAMRAEIEARDWSQVHISGDRAKPFLWERVRRTWIK
jgi:hypothetical protein